MSEHFLCSERVRKDRRGKNCGSHLYLPRLYGVPISRYIKVIGSRVRAKTNWGRRLSE
jgi:hypothetical protein